MIIAIDGSIGSGKTSLANLLNIYFKDSEAVPFERENDTLLKNTTKLISTARQQLNTEIYTKEAEAITMLLLYTARLKLLQANTKLKKNKFVFVDTFFDPLWYMREKDWEQYYHWLTNLVKLPDISLFLDVEAKQSYRRRKGESLEEYKASAEKHQVIDKRRGRFCRWAKIHIPNFHVIDARKPIQNVVEQAIEIIKTPVEKSERQPAPKEKAPENITSLRQQSMRNTEL